MNTYSIIKSSNKNSYLILRGVIKRIEYLHPILEKIILFTERYDNITLKNHEILSQFFEKNVYTKEMFLSQLRKYYLYKDLGYFKKINRDYLDHKFTTADIIKQSILSSDDIAFELTENCNLSCSYCAYSSIYDFYLKRENKNIDIKIITVFMDFLYNNTSLILNKKIDKTISFYGGEPLLQIKTIKEVVNFCHKYNDIFNIKFGITTNGLLLEKYMDYLVSNNFFITISIDGDKKANYFRQYKNGKESFKDLIHNVDLLKEKYPDFFNTNVIFNSVFTKKNNFIDSITFFHNRYDKDTNFSDVNEEGVSKTKVNEFKQLFKNYEQEYHKTSCKDISFLTEKKFKVYNPFYSFIGEFMPTYENTIFSYNDLFGKFINKRINSATCLPGRKLFITAKGKILSCENINHKYSVGNVDNKKVNISYDKEANKYEGYLKSFKNQCKKCYRFDDCPVCMYSLNLDEENVVCDLFLNEKSYNKYMIEIIDYLENNNFKFN